MNKNIFLDEILIMLRTIKDDTEQLEILHQFMLNELNTEVAEETQSIKIPERFLPLVKDLADSLSAGMVCYINTDTLEKIDFPKSIVDNAMFDKMSIQDDDEEEEDEKDKEPVGNESDKEEVFFDEEDFFYEDLKKIKTKWKQKIIINPPDSHESFSIMEQFVNTLSESRIYKRLSDALSGRKPFANFNNIIHQSDERENWFAFRQSCLERYVTEAIAFELRDNNSDT